jgi:hypothetical protein
MEFHEGITVKTHQGAGQEDTFAGRFEKENQDMSRRAGTLRQAAYTSGTVIPVGTLGPGFRYPGFEAALPR